MHNSCVPIALNTTLLIGVVLWNVTVYDMYNNLHFHKSYIIVDLWYKNLKFDQTYLPKGSLMLVILGILSVVHVHYQNPQLYSTGLMMWIHWKWILRRLRVQRKPSLSHSHHNLLRFLVQWLSPQYWSSWRIGSEKMF